MFIKSKFKDWDETCLKSVSFKQIKYIRTFSVEEFKQFFSVEKIFVKKHIGGFLFFECLRLDWGLVICKGVLENPVISIVSEYWGNVFFVLHEKDNCPQYIHINSAKEQARLNLLQKSRRNNYSMSWQEYNEYIKDSYMDAFEGDSDAYWNID